MFFLALSLGLAEDPFVAVERMAGLVEETAERHGIEDPLRMSIAAADGERLWVFRYSSEYSSPSLYYSTDVRTLRELYPDNPRLESVSDDARVVVSEPLSEFPGVWNQIPEASCGVLHAGEYEQRAFRPRR